MIAILPPEKSKELAREKLAQWRKQKEKEALEAKLKGKAGESIPEGIQREAMPRERLTPSRNKSGYERLYSQLRRSAKKGDMKGIRDAFAAGAPLSAGALNDAFKNNHNEVVEFLILQGADLNPGPEFVREALFIASVNHRRDLVELLVSRGLDVDTKFTGTTALRLSAYWNLCEAADILIDNGANVDDCDYGLTILMESSRMGHKEIVDLLAVRGADVNARDSKGKSALDYASENGYREIADFLRKHGAG